MIRMSGIVQQLLTMYNADEADIDHWQIGFKGLLALGLLVDKDAVASASTQRSQVVKSWLPKPASHGFLNRGAPNMV